MPTRFILAGLRFFAAAAALGLALVVLAPIGAVRIIGLVGVACAAIGALLQLYALRRVDPQAFVALRFRSVLHHHRQ